MGKHKYPFYPELSGLTVVVTGGSKGIGLEISRAFVQNGATTVVVGRSDSAALDNTVRDLTAEGAGVEGHLCDLADSDQVRSLFEGILERHRKVDVLVNNAGGVLGKNPLPKITDETWQALLGQNLTSAFNCCREVVPGMIDTGRGRIVNMSSQAATNPPWVTGAHYASSKAGLLGLTRHTARECAANGITSNALIVGATATERLLRNMTPAMEAVMSTVPAGRYAHPWELASVVLFLASDGAGYINGAVINVTGGFDMS